MQPLKVPLDDAHVLLPDGVAGELVLVDDRVEHLREECHVRLGRDPHRVQVGELKPRPVEAVAVEAELAFRVAQPVGLGLLGGGGGRGRRVEREQDLPVHHHVLVVVDDRVAGRRVGRRPQLLEERGDVRMAHQLQPLAQILLAVHAASAPARRRPDPCEAMIRHRGCRDRLRRLALVLFVALAVWRHCRRRQRWWRKWQRWRRRALSVRRWNLN